MFFFNRLGNRMFGLCPINKEGYTPGKKRQVWGEPLHLVEASMDALQVSWLWGRYQGHFCHFKFSLLSHTVLFSKAQKFPLKKGKRLNSNVIYSAKETFFRLEQITQWCSYLRCLWPIADISPSLCTELFELAELLPQKVSNKTDRVYKEKISSLSCICQV